MGVTNYLLTGMILQVYDGWLRLPSQGALPAIFPYDSCCHGFRMAIFCTDLLSFKASLVRDKKTQRPRGMAFVSLVPREVWQVFFSPPKLGGGNSNIFYFHPYLGKRSNLTNIFQRGWNHQPEKVLQKVWGLVILWFGKLMKLSSQKNETLRIQLWEF